LDTRYRKIDMGKIGQKTQKDTHRKHWTKDTYRYTRVILGIRHREIDTGNIGHKTEKDRHGNIGQKTQKDRHG
jgi:hypothetical protein